MSQCHNLGTTVLMGLSIFSFLNQAHANSNVNQETTQSNSTQVKVENKDVPKDVDRLAKKNFLSHVSLLDQASHTSKVLIHWVSHSKFTNSINKVMATSIIPSLIKVAM